MLLFAKITVLILAFVVAAPLASILARSYDKIRDLLFFLMVFFTCTSIDLNLFPMPLWKGTSRGFAFTAVDFFCLSLMGGLLMLPTLKFSWRPPGAILYFIYCTLSFISFFTAEYPLQAGFEILKMFWMYLFFIVTYNYIVSKKSFWPLIYAVISASFVMLIVAIYQRYGLHIYQVNSTLSHQNSLAFYGSICGCLLLGVLFNEKTTRWQDLLLFTAFLSTVLLVYFTLSRAGLAAMFFGLTLTTAMTLILNGFSRKRSFLFIILIFGAGLTVLMTAPRIKQRFQEASSASKQTRINLAKAATRIANDYRLGVGLNNFSVYSSSKYDYAFEQYEAGMSRTDLRDENGPIVETIYLLVAAECGWITFAALLLWMGTYWRWCFGTVIALRRQACFGILAGVLGGLTATYLQSTLEWVFKQHANFYLLMLTFAIIASLRNKKQTAKKNIIL